jgi:tol-pal system protein YbgF
MKRQFSLMKKGLALLCSTKGSKRVQLTYCFLGLFLISSLTIFTACASQKRVQSYQVETDNLRRELKFVKEQNLRLRRELDEVKKRLAEQERISQQNKADLATQIEELSQQLEVIQNQLQDTNYRMNTLSRKLGYPPVSKPTFEFEQPGADTTTSPKEESPLSFGVDESREFYNTAYSDLIRGNYQLALQGFRQFLERYPTTDLSDNAQYWIGEVYYAQGRFQKAVEEFGKVISLYPNGDKVPSALLKIGYAYISMDDYEQGKLYLQEVVREHPDSEEAKLAKGRLTTLK